MGSRLDAVRGSAGALRVSPWRGDHEVAYLAPAVGARAPSAEAVRSTCEALVGQGWRSVLTAALGPVEARPFLHAGFEVHERLHLLSHDLLRLPTPPPGAILRRARPHDRAAVLDVDGRAFTSFWRLDGPALDEALAATPSVRFRVATIDGDVVGYAVTGRAGTNGFLQRLAVDPACGGRGLGRALVLDGLGWCRRRRVARVVVNTQVANQRALELYLALGFHQVPGGLAVLRAELARR